MNDFVRTSLHLCWWIFCLVASLAATVACMFVNYSALKTSLELLGTEMRPGWTDELVGPILNALMPQATFAHFNAMVAAAMIWFGFFLFVHFCFEIYQLIEERIGYLAAGGQAEAAQAKRLIVRDVVLIVVLGAVLLPILNWDLNMYQFRSAAAALGIEDPRIASTTIPSMDLLLERNKGLFAFRLIPMGAIAYLAITLLGCISYEVCRGKVSDAWSRFATVSGELYNAIEQRLVGQGDELQYADESLQYADESQLTENQHLGEATEPAPAPTAESVTAPNGTGTASPATFGRLFDDAPGSPTRTSPAALALVGDAADQSAQPDTPDDALDVIGSPGERATRAAALRDPRLIVDQHGIVWLRSHYDSVNDAAA